VTPNFQRIDFDRRTRVFEHPRHARQLNARQTSRPIIGKSEAIRRALEQLDVVAPTSATVLLLGETGVGKEVVAQAIHEASPRRHRAMISISCGAIAPTLIESELFGLEAGAFTGATSRRIGRFEAAHGSTVFLDEIGELPLNMQVKLLRVIQERTIERLGGSGSTKLDVRIIAATNRDLEDAVRRNTFREDLYYRLNVFPITVPPLRERAEDIPDLAWALVEELSGVLGKTVDFISSEGLGALRQYWWPGNVRELRNVIERALILASGPALTPTVPVPPIPRVFVSSRLDDLQAAYIRSVLDSCGWRIRGRDGAAARLGLKPTTLESRMARFGIVREQSPVRHCAGA
jgi:transcriptional regulator with GAF, ATPase, and Fis domain